MTTNEYLTQLNRRLNALDEAKLIYPIATEIHRRQLKRLFDEGEKASGKIGSYSTKTMLATKSQFVKQGAFKQTVRTVTRKNGKAKKVPLWLKFKNASKAVPVMELTGGYKQFREIQGRQGAFVDLQLSKDLRNDYAAHLKTDGNSVVSTVSRKINRDKISWLSAKYGSDLFKLNEKEKDFFATEATKALLKYLQ